ncbi:MAG: hypothetical protein H6737_23480 [Alphaproteobacteria bacterium]|nr:hypothetical protein [Alphaproteobacteria bacterium]
MTDVPRTLDLTVSHARQSTMAAVGGLGGGVSFALGLGAVALSILGAMRPEALDCDVARPTEACVAALPEGLRGLPDLSLAVWFHADHADAKWSPRQYLQEEARWAAALPPGTTSDSLKGVDGRVPSRAALDGELEMRRAVLPGVWAPPSRAAGLGPFIVPMGIGAVGMLAVAVWATRRSRTWTPIAIKVAEDHVSIGNDKLAFDELMTIDVAPLRLSSGSRELVLPPGYDLAPSDHEVLVEVLQASMDRAREQFLDEDDA